MNIMPGMIMPERNCALKLASNSSWLSASNLARESSSRPNTLTRACPEKDSSTRAFRRPTLRHWMPNAFCERGPMMPKITAMSGSETSATIASCHEMENIITSTPTTVSTEVTTVESDCCIVCVMLSMSLVTREMSSPRCTLSKYESGMRLIFASTSARSWNIVRTMITLITKPCSQPSSADAT